MITLTINKGTGQVELNGNQQTIARDILALFEQGILTGDGAARLSDQLEENTDYIYKKIELKGLTND